MPSVEPQAIFVPKAAALHSTLRFELFPALQTELRQYIWQLSMTSSRILHVNIRSQFINNAVLAKQGKPVPSEHKDDRYAVVVRGYGTVSKYFRVCRESRALAKTHFRVHIPCWLNEGVSGDTGLESGVLYMNPVSDFFCLSSTAADLQDFLFDLKTSYDPRGTGLLNLAVSFSALNTVGGLSLIDPDALEPPVRDCLRETLAQLREVIFIETQFTGRYVFGYRSGARTGETTVNLSYPVMAWSPKFERLSYDPRAIDQDLQRVFLHANPMRVFRLWNSVISTHVGRSAKLETKFSFALGLDHVSERLRTHAEADKFLQQEQHIWWEERQKEQSRRSSTASTDIHPGFDSEKVDAAFGFWLFPMSAFTKGASEDTGEGERDPFPTYLNLRDHWPELACSPLRD